MGAFLVFADEFKLASSGIEYEGVDEVEYPVSYGRLERLKSYCETIGISKEAWPDFVDADGDPSQVSLTDINERNTVLKQAVLRLEEDAISQNEELKLVVEELRQGRMLFITN